MKKRLLAALLMAALIPVAALAWVGYRLVSEQDGLLRREQEKAERQQLEAVDQAIALHLDKIRLEITGALNGAGDLEPDSLEERFSREPRISGVFVLDETGGMLLSPDPGAALSEANRSLVARLARPVLNGEFTIKSAEGDFPAGRASGTRWYVRYGDNGLELFLLHSVHGTGIIGMELNRIRLMSDLIAALPSTPQEDSESPLRQIRVINERNEVFYAWGGGDPPEEAVPALTLPLRFPLNAWHLRVYSASPTAGLAGQMSLIISALFAFVGLAVGLLLVYAIREYRRNLDEAARRVNFVNQVSHELKTPLTSIRMYADLLEDAVDESDSEARRKLDVIQEESSRLTRLIENVLTLGRNERGTQRIHPRPGILDECIRSAIGRMEPSLKRAGIEIERDLNAPGDLSFDSDAIEQIIENLLSNVEKYAADGGRVRITSGMKDGVAVVQVGDRGSGIPHGAVERVFLPFERLDHALDSGTSGAGIGLAISRSLARLHGGDLALVETEEGALFELTLPVGKGKSS